MGIARLGVASYVNHDPRPVRPGPNRGKDDAPWGPRRVETDVCAAHPGGAVRGLLHHELNQIHEGDGRQLFLEELIGVMKDRKFQLFLALDRRQVGGGA